MFLNAQHVVIEEMNRRAREKEMYDHIIVEENNSGCVYSDGNIDPDYDPFEWDRTHGYGKSIDLISHLPVNIFRCNPNMYCKCKCVKGSHTFCTKCKNERIANGLSPECTCYSCVK